MRWKTVIPRDTLYEAAALALRLAIGGLFAHHAWGAIDNTTLTTARIASFGIPRADVVATILPHLELACATAFSLGVLTPLAGGTLAGLQGGALWLALTAQPPLAPEAAPALIVLTIVACLPATVHAGRFAVDHLAFARPAAPRHRATPKRSSRGPETSGKRPEQAPPLPYPDERAVFTRPSRT